MKAKREQLALILQGDATLKALLASNRPWHDTSLPETKESSIIPFDKGPLEKTPYVTIQGGPDVADGVNKKDAFFYVRCYNDRSKTFVSIDNVLDRIRVLLHKHRFTFDDGTVSIDTYLEATGAETPDEAYNQLYRESRYRVEYI